MPTDKIVEAIANILVANPELANLINTKVNDTTTRAKQTEVAKAKKLKEIDDELKVLEENRASFLKEIDRLKTINASINGKIGSLIKLRKQIADGTAPVQAGQPKPADDLKKVVSKLFNIEWI